MWVKGLETVCLRSNESDEVQIARGMAEIAERDRSLGAELSAMVDDVGQDLPEDIAEFEATGIGVIDRLSES